MSVPFNNNDTVVYDGRDVYLPKDTSVTAFEDSRVFLFGEWYLNGQPLLSGGSLPSGIEVGIGPIQPTDPGVVLWWDTSVGYGELKVKFAGSWKQIEDPTEAGGTLPTASETNPGIVELATPAEALAAIDAIRAVTPLCLQNYANLTYLGANYPSFSYLSSNHYTKTQADANVASGLSNKVDKTGDTMTGILYLPRIRLTAVDDVSLASTLHAFQIGADNAANLSMDANEIMAMNNGVAATLYLNYDGGAVAVGPNSFTTNGPASIAGLLTTAAINAGGIVTVTEPGAALKIVNTGASGGYVAYYDGATRRGYTGHYPDGHMSLTADTGYVYIRSGGGYIIFQDGGTERMRMNASGNFLCGHTSEGTLDVGCEIRGTSSGMIAGWVGAAGTANLWLSRIGAAIANDQPYVTFRSSSTQIGSIVQYGASGIGYNQSSDYRLKEVLGPVTTPIRRLKYLRPWHYKWKADGLEEDGFLAHEVDPVVPACVFGEKDAMYPDDHETNPGEPNYQQMDITKMIPLTVAGIQELISQVENLQARVAALEAV